MMSVLIFNNFIIRCIQEITKCSNTFVFIFLQNWLPRNVMSAWRIAGIVHALEAWNEHECGINTINILNHMNKVWEATLRHGFQPLSICP